MDRTLRVLFPKIIIDLMCIAVLGFTILFVYLFAEPYKRGFFCSDESLRHPVHKSTVNNIMLYIVGVFVPICVMLFGEFLFTKNLNRQSSTVQFGRVNFVWIASAYEKVTTFAFGAVITVFTTDVAKYTIGRLRPHFFEFCEPDVDCTLPENQLRYIVNFTCQGSKSKEVRLSFPSGHSSFSAYVMIYLALYLQLRMKTTGSNRLLRPFLQLICLIAAWYTAMSRVSDYKHHWSDVLCGMLIGIIVSFITVFCIGGFFKKNRQDGCDMMTTDALNARNNAETAMQDEVNPLRRTSVGSPFIYGGVSV